MVRLDNVAKHFGGRTLFEGASLRLLPGARIGLVGANGSGKTTLFRIIAGDMEPDAGVVVRPKGTTVGHLPQDVGDIGDRPILRFVLAGRGDILEARAELEALSAEIEANAHDTEAVTEIADRMGLVSERLEALGGYDLESRAQEILGGMGFLPEQFDAPANSLSGGWRVRLVLCQLLLQQPDVLLLDEPTNHLDVPSVEWLEGFLRSYAGTVIVISHDRFFLNRLVTSIASIEPGGLYVQEGDYDAYEVGYADRAEALAKAKARQDREIAQLERFVERFRAKASKAKQAQSRVKRLEKIERIETMENRKALRRFAFAEAPREGKDVVSVDAVAKAYGDNHVYRAVDFRLHRGERVALVGPNGQGKSTLLKLIVGDTQPDSGDIELGHNVMVAYFGQHQVEELDLGRTLLEEMEAHAPVDEVPRCRSILGNFMFSGDDVKKKIAVLSGGEKNRVALAKLLLRPTNFLVLDEPTNHLDMESRETLLEALDAFPGAILFVSHDRYFINGLATRVVHVAGGEARSFEGDYDAYHAALEKERAAAPTPTTEATTATQDSKRERKRRDAALRDELKRKTQKDRRRIEDLEKRIAELEERTDAISTKLADPEFFATAPGAEVSELTREYQSLTARTEAAMEEWTTLTERVEDTERTVREAHAAAEPM